MDYKGLNLNLSNVRLPGPGRTCVKGRNSASFIRPLKRGSIIRLARTMHVL